MKILRRLTFILLTIASFTSCSNELDILDDYKDIPIVYSLLNRNDTTHLIRIQRAFLGAGNALVFAQNPDSIYYDPATIEVILLQTKTNGIVDTLICRPRYDIIKEEGLFTDDKHVLYQANKFTRNIDGSLNYIPYFSLVDDANYTLSIKNKKTGMVYSGSTKIVNPIGQQTLFPSSKVNLASEFPFNIRFVSGMNGKIYGLIMRFKYKEVNNATSFVEDKYIDYYLTDQLSRTTRGNETMIFLLNGDEIFRFLGKNIKENTSITRPIFYVDADFIFTCGSEDMYNYIQINAPGNTVNYIPDYSNIENGKGIFTSRLVTTIPSIKFSSATQDSLISGRFTKGLFN